VTRPIPACALPFLLVACTASEDPDGEPADDVSGTWQIDALAFEDDRVRQIPEEDPGLLEGRIELRETLSGTILLAYDDSGRVEEEWTVSLADDGDQYTLSSAGGYADMDMTCVQADVLMDCTDSGDSDWQAIDPKNWLRELQLSRPE